MVVKYIAALAYTGTWAVIILGAFRGLPLALWFVSLAMAFLGAISAWNALHPSQQTSQHPSQGCACGHDTDSVQMRANESRKL